jgi:hypothetical protein
MAISINKNEIIHMDDYFRDRKRETFKPLIQNMAEDMLANGFVDVGPSITKITINDDELTTFIDEFICFYYDSSVGSGNVGASGINLIAGAGTTSTVFNLDASPKIVGGIVNSNLGDRRKFIDDVYEDLTWNQKISKSIPNAAGPPAQTMGPNSELFAYLNPHPNMRGSRKINRDAAALVSDMTSGIVPGTTNYPGVEIGSAWADIAAAFPGVIPTALQNTASAVNVVRGDPTSPVRPDNLSDGGFYKKLPPAVAISQTQTGYVGLPEVSRAVYQNEFNKVKSLVTNNNRGVVMMPELSTGINTKAKIRMYKTVEQDQGPDLHDFWITSYKDENFFPPNTVEPKKFIGELLIGFDQDFLENTFQTGDQYKFIFEHTAFGTGAVTYEILVDVVDDTLQGMTEAIYNKLVISPLCDPVAGFYNVENGGKANPARNGVILFESKRIGHNLTCSVVRKERETTVFANDIQSFVVNDYNNKQNSTMNSGQGATPVDVSGTNTYIDGYVHQIQIRGFDGTNNDDEFEFTLTGLIDELPNGGIADLAAITTHSETFYFKTPRALNSAQLATAIANTIRANSYANNYLEVVAQSNAVMVRYKPTSSAYMKKAEVGKSHGLLALPSTTFSAGGGTIGESRSTENAPNGFSVADLPAAAAFGVEGTAILNGIDGDGNQVQFLMRTLADTSPYTSATLYSGATFNPQTGPNATATAAANAYPTAGTITIGDPFDYGADNLGDIEVIQEGLGMSVDSVRLSFPLARDLGTFANPVNGNYNVHLGQNAAGGTNYFVSYNDMIIEQVGRNNLGPELSFDPLVNKMHPNVKFGGASNGEVSYADFDKYEHEIKIDAFEYITDYSMGPIVLETDRKHSLSGHPTGIVGDTEGDQPWRIRLNVSRGKEILEASPYINDAVLQIKSDDDASSVFEYLQVHVATEFQLKSDGELVKPEGRDGIKPAILREPGHLGGLRPQYSGYLQTAIHKINPFVNRENLDASVISGFNSYAGMVGTRHFDNTWTKITGLSDPFARGNTPVYFNAAGGTAIALKGPPSNPPGTPVDWDLGVLENDEYRFEEKYLRGSSTELVHDTPFNDGRLRLQKGFFRRTGKSHPDIAPAYPMSYHMTIADHGIAFYLKDQASTAQSDDNAFFVVQRHVHSSAEIGTGTSGAPQFRAGYIDSGLDGSDHQPIHCVYQTSEPALLYSDLEAYFTSDQSSRVNSIMNQGIYDSSGNQISDFIIDEVQSAELDAMDLSTQGRFRRFVVREKDVLKPWDRHVFAGLNERDSTSIINPLEQLSLNDRGKLVIQFPNRLGSQRFLYTGKELDMIGFCAAGAVGQDTLISSDRMSDASAGGTGSIGDYRRLYRGMMSTGEYGSGMRILLLVAMNEEGDSVMETTADIRLLDN